MGNCTQCHRLGTRGIADALCLECHGPLARRIQAGTGYHGRLPEKGCGSCHKEHLGLEFRVARFNPDLFRHDSTGYTLRGAHGEVECAACHREDRIQDASVLAFKGTGGALARTYLGLGTECVSCHAPDDPHAGQFQDRGCDDCHDEGGWEDPPGFDHGETTYPLDGRHREVECSLCHKSESGDGGAFLRYRPRAHQDCRSCHADPHEGGMKGRCDGCHVTAGWEDVPRGRLESTFDHATTDFPLEGAHLEARCAACHDPQESSEGIRLRFASATERRRSFPRPTFETCAACHVDPHEGESERRSCDACHGSSSWFPSSYGLARHDEETGVLLEGAHRVTPCAACHVPAGSPEGGFRFRIAGYESCLTCHQEDDPHVDSFQGAACDLCHGKDTFQMDTFDHARPEIEPWIDRCATCHGDGQPHGEQFQGRECGECHGTESFRIERFDHSRTRFLLDGSHAGVACVDCHRLEPWEGGGSGIRYRPLETECAACHTGGATLPAHEDTSRQ